MSAPYGCGWVLPLAVVLVAVFLTGLAYAGLREAIFALAPSLGLTLMGLPGVVRYAACRRWRAVQAKAMSAQEKSAAVQHRGGAIWVPRYDYIVEYTIAGEIHRAELRSPTDRGERFVVYVHPERPNAIVLDRRVGWLSAITFGAGVASLTLLILAYVVLR